MKRIISTLALALASASAFAQLQPGSVAPDFTVTDINGNTHNLYNYLSQGKTVFLDVSAAWCAPCWNYHHTVKALDALWTAHGTTGATGVSASTTNDVMIIMIEGETTNTRAQLYGTSSGTAHSTYSQGDWVTGTNYPIVDTGILNTPYAIGYFPTIYMVCRDHLVREVGQQSATALYAASQASCPNYAPSTTVDAKAIDYSDKKYFYCTAAPTVKFQNYSATNSITSATIKVYNGSTVVATVPWTGNLAPYAVATVSIPAITATSFGPYKFDVTVSGDSKATNNASVDSIFKVYNASSVSTIPSTENFEGISAIPYKYAHDIYSDLYTTSNGVQKVTGSDGNQTQALAALFYYLGSNSTTEFVVGNYNSSALSNVSMTFDLSYSSYTATTPENDKLEVLVSKDCGATWASAWSKSGTALQTTPAATPAAQYFPTAANQWRRETVWLNNYKSSNMIVKFKGTSAYGNNAWIDNVKLVPTLAVGNVIADNSVRVYPNPAREAATLDFTPQQGRQDCG